MLTLRHVFENVCQILDLENLQLVPTYIRYRVLSDINAALQMIQTSGRDYFTRERTMVALVEGTAAYALDQTVLNVLLPARLTDGTPLLELETRGEYDRFGQIYLSRIDPAPEGKPMAIYLDRTRQGGNDPVKLQALFAPTPDDAYTAELEISRVPPVFTLDQVSDPSPVVPIAHGFTESILLPIARWNVRTSHFFRRHEMLPDMEAQYRAALEQLGISDPKINKPASPPDVLERARNAARAAAAAAYKAALQAPAA
jgi:hypothetical protein